MFDKFVSIRVILPDYSCLLHTGRFRQRSLMFTVMVVVIKAAHIQLRSAFCLRLCDETL